MPGVSSRLIYVFIVWKSKSLLIRVQEVLKKELDEHLLLHLFWQLNEYVEIHVLLKGCQSIHFPSVVKVYFNSIFEILIHIFFSVKVPYGTEEFWKIVTISNIFVKLLELWEDFNKVAHDIRKNGYSEKQNEGRYKSLEVASRVVVTKADSRKGSESEVSWNDQVFYFSVFIDAEVWEEKVWCFFEWIV